MKRKRCVNYVECRGWHYTKGLCRSCYRKKKRTLVQKPQSKGEIKGETMAKERDFKTLICKILNGQYPYKHKIVEEDIVDDKKNRWAFTQTLQTLEPREVAIIVAYDYCNFCLRDVGELFGLTYNRVAQIRDKAYRKLRHPVRARRVLNHLKEDIRKAVKNEI